MFGLFNSKIQNVIIVKTVQCSRLLIYSNNSKTTVQSLMTLKVSYSIKNGVYCLKKAPIYSSFFIVYRYR